jgi:hypothetical protein
MPGVGDETYEKTRAMHSRRTVPRTLPVDGTHLGWGFITDHLNLA